MEALFKKFLENPGRNTVEEILKWLKKAKLIDNSTQVDTITKMLSGSAKKGKVQYADFNKAVMDLAKEKKIDAAAATKQLTEAAGESAAAGASKAAKDAATSAAKGATNAAKGAADAAKAALKNPFG